MTPTRREFFSLLTGWIAAAIGATLAVPAVGYFIGPALKRKTPGWLNAGAIAGLSTDQPVQREVVAETVEGWYTTQSTKGVWVVKLSTGEIQVYNPHCTHLGCAYAWNPDAHQFQCPCHGGVYNLDGRVIAGPPPRPLDTLEYRVEGDTLEVKYEDYKSGTHDKTPL
ncbi:MAG TPA: ubiquinol-cytochrome c reductase iron-sulfur subunit [Nitrospiria bacterium]|nr:ubiquinol-cytochrome c reductase iron-sulfur subunit [Nitrospiria bacterium]